MTQATPKDYWISSSALYIELNALGNPDYIQASCVSGAQILVHVTNIITYDAGHNYRRWSLQASPTIFNTHTAKYVYAAIPRDMESTGSAYLVFPSEELDIYGKNAKEEQIGTEDYYYIYLQGIISSSGDNGTINRDWTQRISTGYLSSDEAIDASTSESEWYSYSSVDQITTFLKDLTMKAGTKFRELAAKTFTIVSGGSITFEGQGTLERLADDTTDVRSESEIVTPIYVDDRALSKTHDDTAEGHITFEKGLTADQTAKLNAGATIGDLYHLDKDGFARLSTVVLDLLQSSDYNYAEQSGFGFYKRHDGKYGLNITDLMIWGKAIFNSLEIRKLYSVGGNIVLSPSSSKLIKVEDYYEADALTGEQVQTGWKCYLLADDGTMATTNQWRKDDQVRCQTFDIAEGTYENVSNKNYWRRIKEVSTTNEVITDENGTVLYDGKKFAWIVIYKDDCMEGSDEPSADDTIVCMGNRTNTDRQHVLMMETAGDHAPSITMYRGVNTYSLTGRSIFDVSYDGLNVVSKYFNLQGASGEKIYTPVYVGYWKEGKEYEYYNEVTWMGTRWLCVAPEGDTTTEEPSSTSAYWQATTTILVPTLVLDTDLLQTGISIGETHTITCRLMLGDTDITTSVQTWKITRKTEDSLDDAAWALLSKAKNFAGSIDLTWSNDGTEDDIGSGDSAVFTVTATTTTGDIHEIAIAV